MVSLLFAAVAGVKWPAEPRKRDGANYLWFTWSDGAKEIRMEEGQPGFGHIEGEWVAREEKPFPSAK